CILALIVKNSNLVFSLSIAGLLFVNSLMHIMGSIRVRGYTPGLVTGILLYLPFSIYGYSVFLNSGQLTLSEGFVTLVLGILYQAVPIAYLALSGGAKQA
ncbi:MAG TPA: HXXEE domain-containing protein, partial [Anaerolineales bacterium]|nr:HXXEE domain-containing protein [Anaerolineales bacterium]